MLRKYRFSEPFLGWIMIGGGVIVILVEFVSLDVGCVSISVVVFICSGIWTDDCNTSQDVNRRVATIPINNSFIIFTSLLLLAYNLFSQSQSICFYCFVHHQIQSILKLGFSSSLT